MNDPLRTQGPIQNTNCKILWRFNKRVHQRGKMEWQLLQSQKDKEV